MPRLVLLFASLLIVASTLLAVEPAKLQANEYSRLKASAATPADHARLAAHYQAMVDETQARLEHHEKQAEATRGIQTASYRRPMTPGNFEYHNHFAKVTREKLTVLRQSLTHHMARAGATDSQVAE